MRLLILFLFFHFFSIDFTCAQSFNFAQAPTGYDIQFSYTKTDKYNNIFIAGSFNGTADFNFGVGTNNLTAVGNFNMFLLKEDAFGNFIWVKHFPGFFSSNPQLAFCRSIIIDSQQNIYLAGVFVDSFDFDPGPGVFTMSSYGSDHAFIEKLDSNGNFIWAKHFGGFGMNNYAEISDFKLNKSLSSFYLLCPIGGTIDADPGINTYPIVNSNTLGNDILIEKIDTAGNFIWAKQIKGTNDHDALTLAIDTNDNLYFAGKFKDSIDFDPGPNYIPALSVNTYDLFVEKLDSSGNYVWAKHMGEPTYDEQSRGIAVDIWNNVLVTGNFGDTVDFDPGPAIYNLSTPSASACFLLKLNSNGNFVWANSIGANSVGGNDGRGVNTDSLGCVYTYGEFNSTIDFNPGSGVCMLTPQGFYDVFIQKLDSSGNFLWADGFGTTGWDIPCNNICLDASNNILVAGLLGSVGQSGFGDFDPGLGVFNMGGSNLGFIEKLCNSAPLQLNANTLVFCEGDTALLYSSPLPNTSFQWVKDGTIIPNYTGDTLKVYQSGNYSVSVPGNSCSQSTIFYMQALPVGHPGISIVAPTVVPFGQQATITANLTGITGAYFIHWFVNGQMFTTNNSATFSYTKAWGIDTVFASILVQAPCNDTSLSATAFIMATESIANISTQNQFLVYPNPAKDKLHVQSFQVGCFVLTDITGRTVSKSQILNPKFQTEIDISSLDKGVYLLRFFSNEGAVETVKVVKE